jgi:hypothetical protein
LNILFSLASGQFNPLTFVAHVSIVFAFINGIRGAFAYHRLREVEAAR